MIKTILFLTLFGSINAFSCPQLAGEYKKCTTGDRAIDILSGINRARFIINQNGDSFKASFMGVETNIKVGEVTNTTFYSQEQRATIHSEVTAQCDQDILKVRDQSHIVFDNGDIVDSITDSNIYLISNGKKIVTELSSTDGSRQNDMTITCKRR